MACSVNTPGAIETVSGKYVSPIHCTPEDIDIDDIAWALSRINRFAGHTITEVPYNVAQHSVFVCDMIANDYPEDKYFQFYGLMHDTGEAYIGDIPSPIKRIDGLGEIFKAVEHNLLSIIMTKYVGNNVPSEEMLNQVDYYDKKALHIEAHAFMKSRGQGWCNYGKYDITLIELQRFPHPLPSIKSYLQFMERFNELYSIIKA